MKFVILLLVQAVLLGTLFLFPTVGLYGLTVASVLLALASVFGLFRSATLYALSLIAEASKDTLEPWKSAILAAVARGINISFLYFLLAYSNPVLLSIYVVSSLAIHANAGRERAFRQRMIRNSYGYVKA